MPHYLGVNFINVLRVHFSYKIFGAKISNPKASFVVFGTKISYKKCARMMLMKLTVGCNKLVSLTDHFPEINILKHFTNGTLQELTKRTVKHGYNDHGYNEFTFITNNLLLNFWSQMRSYYINLTVITNHCYNEHFWLVPESSL